MGANESSLTPMMAQYRRVKSELPPNTLLLFRLGDFYEMFFEDAQASAQILNVALTKRGVVPMCGIPYHAANTYISKLLQAGRKVAVCDQVEEAKPGKLVKRDVTQILSPGAHFDERMLAAEQNNYLATVYPSAKKYGLSVVDLTTGDFRVTEITEEAAFLAELERLRPAEIVYPSEAKSLHEKLSERFAILTPYDDWVFAIETSEFTLRDHLKVASLDGYGLRERPAAVGAAGAAIHYLSQQLRRDVGHLSRLAVYQCSDYLIIDSTTLRNLEILDSLRKDAPKNACLYGAMNRTVTPMGARRLRDWLSQPLASIEPIRRRQDAVELMMTHSARLDELRERLKDVRDLERTITRLTAATGSARDLTALRLGLEQLPALREALQTLLNAPRQVKDAPRFDWQEEAAPADGDQEKDLLRQLLDQLVELPDLISLLSRGIVDDPPLTLKEGGMIRDGFDAGLDELRHAGREGKDWIAKLQADEIERTGIPSLKVRFNSVFGYYIEVTRTHLEKVPAEYVRKQTIANGERYITEALKEMEGKILGAEERAAKLEYDLFLKLREEVVARSREIQSIAQALAQLDVLSSFAETARLYQYCRPGVGDEGVLEIEAGRHPVLDQSVTEERFVPNDTRSDLTEQQIMLITGPNMAGKSTYIRQVALLGLLAHTGSFLPATRARIDLLDRIFTRIGASDDLSRGQSTFMVEMTETANILNNATQKSLVILDEIGRGTSTFDGLSLAWSIVEFLHNQIGAKALFATHYHELTELAGRLGRVKNFNVAVREWNDTIIFLRRIIPGGADRSYGIQVARLAGIPQSVVERAKLILSNLEGSNLSPEGKASRSRAKQRAERDTLQQLEPPPQLDLFG